MANAALTRKCTDDLNVRLSIALNTGAPFCFLGIALGHLPASVVSAMLCCIAGFAFYSFGEYVVHRWILHGLDMSEHREHHRNPTEPHAMLFSTGVTVHTLLLVLLSSLIDFATAIWMVFGSALGYALFVQLHDFQHAHPVSSHRLWSTLHRHHMLHHDSGKSPASADDRGCNYGVLTTVWDRLFGTYRS